MGHDAILVECKDGIVNENSIVCISPFDLKTNEWLLGLNEITTMKEVLRMNVKKVSKDKNVEEFFERHYKKHKVNKK